MENQNDVDETYDDDDGTNDGVLLIVLQMFWPTHLTENCFYIQMVFDA